MFTSASPVTLARRCELLRLSLADPRQFGAWHDLGERHLLVRQALSAGGDILIDAIRAKAIDDSQIRVPDWPWLCIALNDVQRDVVEIRLSGLAFLYQYPCPISLCGAIESLREHQLSTEASHEVLGEAMFREPIDRYVNRHAFFEALNWLIGLRQREFETESVVFRFVNAEELPTSVEWKTTKLVERDVEELRAAAIEGLRALEQMILPTGANISGASDHSAVTDSGPQAIHELQVDQDAVRPLAEAVILRESEDGKQLQRLDVEGAIIRSMPLHDIGEGNATWRKLVQAAKEKEREGIAVFEKQLPGDFDAAGIDAFEEARDGIVQKGRQRGYRPEVHLSGKERQRFRESIWRVLAPEVNLNPSSLFEAEDEAGRRKSIFRVSIWSSEPPAQIRPDHGAERWRKNLTIESEEGRRNCQADTRSSRKRRPRR